MKSIAAYVESELLQDDVAFGALKRGVLNLSQYAQSLVPKIEQFRLETPSLASIVTALSRLSLQYAQHQVHHEVVRFEHISIRTNLSEVTFARYTISKNTIFELYQSQSEHDSFFEVTIGASEITCITNNQFTGEIIERAAPSKPLIVIADLVGITFRFSEKYFDEPAVLYTILRVFALEDISIVEFVSTYREATIICYQKDLDHVLVTIKKFFHTQVTP